MKVEEKGKSGGGEGGGGVLHVPGYRKPLLATGRKPNQVAKPFNLEKHSSKL